MPTVPSYEPNAVATEVGRPNFARNNFDAGPAARAGRALSNAGGTLLSIGLVEQRKADDTQVLGGNRELSQFEIDAWDNPETGGSAKKGRDALGLPDVVLPAFDKKRAELEAGMNARAKARFALIADGRRQDLERKVLGHVGTQAEALNAAETEANATQALTEVAVNYKDPQRIAAATDLGWAGIFARLQRQGAPPEAIKVARQEWESSVKSTLLDQMIANRENKDAIAFYDGNRAALGAKADEYGMKIREARYESESVEMSDQLLRKHGGATPAAYAEAAKIEDPEIRKRTERDIDSVGIREQRAQQVNEQNVRRGAWATIASAPVGATFESVFNASDRVGIDSVPGLRADIQRELDGKLQATETKTDPAVYEKFVSMAPEELAKADVERDFGNLSAQDRVFLINRRDEARKPEKQAQFATEADQLSIAYGDLGLIGEKKAAKRVEFEKAYREDLRVWMQNNKREPTAEERRKLINVLKLPFAKKNTVFGFETGGTTEKPAYQIKPEEMQDFSVPEKERAEFLRRRPNMTEDELKRAYVILKAGQ